jgi:DNA polymerase-3 subunit delta
MAQKKAHEVDGWLRRPDPSVGIVLLYGPDRGLVSERARSFARASGLPLDDAFSVTRLDASEVEQQPGRLVDEARTVPMFADRRLIWVRNAGGQKALADDLKALVEAPPRDALILIEAGDLKKGLALRSLVEAAPAAMALPCYADEGRSVDALIDEEMQKAGLSIDMEARQALRRALGGDRMASRGEIEKLVLYAAGNKSVGLEDVIASTGDAAGLSVDDVVDATLEGRLDGLELAFRRLAAAGNQVFPILAATMRQFQSLHGLRVGMEEKSLSAGAAVAAARPPIFFSRRKTVESALQRWSPEAIARILARLQAAVLQTRRRPELAVAITRQTLMAIALDGGRRPGR